MRSPLIPAVLLCLACTSGPDIRAEPLPAEGFTITSLFPRFLGDRRPAWRFGRVELGGKEYRYSLLGDGEDYSDLDRILLSIDRDEDGDFDFDRQYGEGYEGDARFNVGTGTFRIRSVSRDGRKVVFARGWPRTTVRPYLGTGDVAPDLPTATLGGPPLRLSAHRGREVLLLFWSSW